MLPLIHAKFRRRRGIPYAIEQLSGKQFRCRHCNEVFYTEAELDRHIDHVSDLGTEHKFLVCAEAPRLSSTFHIRVLYTYDIKDRLQRRWLKLKKGESYDGI